MPTFAPVRGTAKAVTPAVFLEEKAVATLSPTATRLLDALRQVAKLVGAARGYHRQTSQVTFFAPVEAVAVAVGCSRQTIYNRLPELVARGLVAQTGHYCSHNGQTRSDGSLWAVKVRDTPGRAKIDYDFLRGSYRSLADDIAKGRTAWALLQSNPRRNQPVDISCVLTFALPPAQKSINDDCKRADAPQLESLIDVPYAPVEARSEAVDNAARAISSILGGATKDLNLCRWIVWSLLRLKAGSNRDYFYSVFLMIQRCAVEKRENACKNATGLLISRLKTAGIWAELKAVRHTRIAVRPIKA